MNSIRLLINESAKKIKYRILKHNDQIFINLNLENWLKSTYYDLNKDDLNKSTIIHWCVIYFSEQKQRSNDIMYSWI